MDRIALPITCLALPYLRAAQSPVLPTPNGAADRHRVPVHCNRLRAGA